MIELPIRRALLERAKAETEWLRRNVSRSVIEFEHHVRHLNILRLKIRLIDIDESRKNEKMRESDRED